MSTLLRSVSVEHKMNFCITCVPFESNDSSSSLPSMQCNNISRSLGMLTISIKLCNGCVPNELIAISVKRVLIALRISTR